MMIGLVEVSGLGMEVSFKSCIWRGVPFVSPGSHSIGTIGVMCQEAGELALILVVYFGSLSSLSMFLILFPTERPGYFGFVLAGDRYDMQGIYADEEEVRRILSTCTDRKDLVFGALEAVTWWRPSIRMVVRFGGGRVFVAGGQAHLCSRTIIPLTGNADAAHVHSPTGAQVCSSPFLLC